MNACVFLLVLQWMAWTLDPVSCHHILKCTWEIIHCQKAMWGCISHSLESPYYFSFGSKQIVIFEYIKVCSIWCKDEECHRRYNSCTKGPHRWSWTADHLILHVSSNLPVYPDGKFGTGCLGHLGIPVSITPCTIFWVWFHLRMPAILQYLPPKC